MVADKPAETPRVGTAQGHDNRFELGEGRSRKTPRDA
jgi:hypothetical protein